MEWIILILVVIGFAGIFYFLNQHFAKLEKGKEDSESQKLMLEVIERLRTDMRSGLDKNSENLQNRLNDTLKLLDQQFNNVRKSVDDRISENTKQLNSRLDNASQVIHGVKEELGRVKEIGPQIRKLHEILGGQKLRGNLGEQVMNDLIAQILPHANYVFQHRFQSGAVVDAVIKTQNGLIPIDSKFPLENFRRILQAREDKEKETLQREFAKDVRKHIRAIHQKYILPEEGTMDFAFMYVPSDAVFFEIIVNNPELSQFAQEKKIYIVSPSMFYSALQVILLSFQSQKFEKHAKQVLSLIQGVKKESHKFGENLSVLHKHVNNAKNKMDEVYTGYANLDLKIQQADQGEPTNLPLDDRPSPIVNSDTEETENVQKNLLTIN